VRGDGTPTRDFLYVEDIAEGLLLAAERLRGFEVVNIASGEEISIGDLVRLIAKLTGFRGQIRFDPSKGGGDPKRSANPERATRLMDFAPSVRLEEGLRRTIAWYNTRRECATPQS
jgi:GDP-L-fucose synthase